MRYTILVLLILITVIRYFNLNRTNKNSNNFLFVSLFVQQIPLGGVLYTLPILRTSALAVRPGAFISYYALDIVILIMLIMLVLAIRNKNKNNKSNNLKVFLLFISFGIISVCNPSNIIRDALFPFYFHIAQLYIFFIFLSKYVTRLEFLKGVFDGLKIAIVFQAFLVVLYPILGVESVLSIFRGDDIGYWATRREGYDSALGTFLHPGALALFSTLSLIFFFACRLCNYYKKEATLCIAVCFFIIFFTFSRTSYITSILSLLVVYFIFNNIVKLKLSSIFLLLVGVIATLIVVFNTPLYDMFFASDSDSQIENRMIHYLLAYEMWEKSKIIGIGINTHVKYMYEILIPKDLSNIHEFFLTNPIHNVNLIVLVETGVLGFVTWCYYIITRVFRGVKNSIANGQEAVIDLSFAGMLIVFTVYGMSGWAGFQKEIYPLLLLLGFFTLYKRKQ